MSSLRFAYADLAPIDSNKLLWSVRHPLAHVPPLATPDVAHDYAIPADLSQRAHRALLPDPVPDATVERLLRAAPHAPSASDRRIVEFGAFLPNETDPPASDRAPAAALSAAAAAADTGHCGARRRLSAKTSALDARRHRGVSSADGT